MKLLLSPLAWLFLGLQNLRKFFYKVGFLPSNRLDRPVICVGNISAGGTGKTPWVEKVTRFFEQQGHDPCILSRGYSGSFKGVLRVQNDMDPRLCGDEPLWLKQNTGAEVYVGNNRVQTGRQALYEVKPSMFVLDDGFQHFRLKRDFNLILLDASAPRDHYALLPVGRLREPFAALERADLVVINKCNLAKESDIDWLMDRCKDFVSADLILKADFSFRQWVPLLDLGHGDRPSPQSSCVTCGLGNPQAFVKVVEDSGIEPLQKFLFADHFDWKEDDIERMTQTMKSLKASDLLITEKDAVKLLRYKKHFQELNIQMWVAKMDIEIQGGDKVLHDLLDARLLTVGKPL